MQVLSTTQNKEILSHLIAHSYFTYIVCFAELHNNES